MLPGTPICLFAMPLVVVLHAKCDAELAKFKNKIHDFLQIRLHIVMCVYLQ